MTERPTVQGVALLFADADLGAHLREAVVDLGARIVYEGTAAEVEPQALVDSGADVVVVNLEPAQDEHIEQLCMVLDQGPQRIVFNDGGVSRQLSGWDRARWARHLAAKLLGGDDVDPPRPVDARAIETTPAQPAVTSEPTEPRAAPESTPVDGESQALHADADPESLARESRESEKLSEELEALLANPELDDKAVEPVSPAEQDDPASPPSESSEQVSPPEPILPPSEQDSEPAGPAAAQAPQAPADWELVDVGSVSSDAQTEDNADFGIDKIDAGDYLKPEGGEGVSPIEPSQGLELVSLEESVAPTMADSNMADSTIDDMTLDGQSTSIRRVAVVCAGEAAGEEVGIFLSDLPETLQVLLLIVRHQTRGPGGQTALATLAATTRLPVNLLKDGAMARHGQVWIVPPGHACRVEHSGRLGLTDHDVDAPGDPSIDECLGAVAEVFGAQTTAIVLGGEGDDGLAGAAAVNEHGGQVWVRDPSAGEVAAGMALAIHEAGLAEFEGTTRDLVEHLVEASA